MLEAIRRILGLTWKELLAVPLIGPWAEAGKPSRTVWRRHR